MVDLASLLAVMAAVFTATSPLAEAATAEVIVLPGATSAEGIAAGRGCDVLALLDPSGGSDPRPLLLEVKSVGDGRDRAFYFSRREHDVAKDVHNDYAIAAVIRPKEGDEPAGIELLVDPVALQDKKISFITDTWLAVYRLDPPATGG